MREGYIILVSHKGIIPYLIKKITHSKFNHVGFFVNSNEIVEANFGGIVRTKFIEYQEKKNQGILEYSLYSVKGLTHLKFQVIRQYLISKIGLKYDVTQFISLALFLIFNISRKIEPIDVQKRFICSELIAEAFHEVNLTFSKNIDPDCITPSDIAQSKNVVKII